MTEVTVTKADVAAFDAAWRNYASDRTDSRSARNAAGKIIARHREEAVAVMKADNERLLEGLEQIATGMFDIRAPHRASTMSAIARTILAETKGEGL